jgi:hypothetical protein
MALRAKIVKRPSADPRLDARVLVSRVGDVVAHHLSRSLVVGVSPIDGKPRTRKSDGRPRGYDTGLLADGIEVERVTGSASRARATIGAPRSRIFFLIKFDDVLTFDGHSDDRAKQAVTDYLTEVTAP